MKAPKAPDPVETAQAQAGVNLSTAITQQNLNMTDQFNPWGSVQYDQTGTTRFQDSFGNWIDVPKFTQTTTLTPEQQAIFDKAQGAQTNLAGIAEEQSARVADTLNDPFHFTNQDAANWAYDLGAERLDPRFAQEEAAIRTQLINSGIREGTAAWDSAMSRFGESKNDAYNQLMLQGRTQAFGENLATRNQPLNELNALLTQSQVSNPAQMSSATPQVGVGGVDYAGMVSDNYQAKMAKHNAMMGGLFGLAGAGASAAIGKWG